MMIGPGMEGVPDGFRTDTGKLLRLEALRVQWRNAGSEHGDGAVPVAPVSSAFVHKDTEIELYIGTS